MTHAELKAKLAQLNAEEIAETAALANSEKWSYTAKRDTKERIAYLQMRQATIKKNLSE